MGCSSCSTATSTGTPSGCQSNGTCGTGGCNKLNVYNWLSDMYLPEGHKPFDIVEVRFKGSRKEFFRNINNLELQVGEMVAVEGNPGHDIGEVSLVGELVRFQLRKRNVAEDSHEIKQLYRSAKQPDIEKWKEVKDLEFKTMHGSRTLALTLGLKMKISDVEYQGDGKKATFFYTADDRVDFRELIKRLADTYKIRVEMRQIGMRQEAARLGGIGSCGRELCCSTWLTDFKVVSTSAARYQNLSLNPIKLAGQCGKLKCCLNFELDSYIDAVRDIPESNIRLQTGKGNLLHRKTDIFKRIMWYAVQPEPREGDERTFFGAEQWVPLSVDRVKEIVALNKLGQKPDDTGAIEIEEEDDLGYDDVVGQDSLTRMDRAKKKKKKKNKGGEAKSASTTAAASSPQQQGGGQQRNRPQRQGDNKPTSIAPQRNKPQDRPDRPQQNKPQDRTQPEKQQATPAQNQSNQKQPALNKPQQPAQNQQARPANPNPQQQQGNRPQRQAPTQGDGRNTPSPNPSASPAPKPATPSPTPSPAPSAPSGNRPPRKAPGSDNA
jgi:cell fate regulator YaaT (PSP1 superfamily)